MIEADRKAAARRIAELAAAFTLLTRLPVQRLGPTPPAAAFGRGVWAYPVVGATIGAAAGGVAAAGLRAGLPASLAAIGAVAASVLLTGGLHEDGVADTADGLGGGSTRARKLAIMRDSRIGSFGAIALVLTLAARLAAIAAIAGTGRVVACLIAAGALGRAGMLVPLLLLEPARDEGMAARLGAVARWPALAGVAVGAALAFAALPAGEALRGIGLALLGALGMTWLCRRHLGGYTGDTLGATCVVVECAVLAGLAAGR